jgi:hypothetical protein
MGYDRGVDRLTGGICQTSRTGQNRHEKSDLAGILLFKKRLDFAKARVRREQQKTRIEE